ncbi:hypothetical protein JCM17478_29550 [Thermopirellula anaerolimosa]
MNGHGRPVRFAPTGGEHHDVTQAEPWVQGLSPEYVIGDKGYDSDLLRDQIRRQGAKPVIPALKEIRRRRYDRIKYKLRNVVERFFNRIKHYRRVATRYEKTAPNRLGFLCQASLLTTILNVNRTSIGAWRYGRAAAPPRAYARGSSCVAQCKSWSRRRSLGPSA